MAARARAMRAAGRMIRRPSIRASFLASGAGVGPIVYVKPAVTLPQQPSPQPRALAHRHRVAPAQQPAARSAPRAPAHNIAIMAGLVPRAMVFAGFAVLLHAAYAVASCESCDSATAAAPGSRRGAVSHPRPCGPQIGTS